jgi:hypothetical protein
MWNRKAMEVVGNSIGRFLKIEEEDLHSTNKKMEKILVEIDIHGGLLDVLEIEWRGLLFVQRLDYLGLPFHCTLCRKTGHLRKECTQIYGSLSDEEEAVETMGDSVTPLEEEETPLNYPGLNDMESSPV